MMNTIHTLVVVAGVVYICGGGGGGGLRGRLVHLLHNPFTTIVLSSPIISSYSGGYFSLRSEEYLISFCEQVRTHKMPNDGINIPVLKMAPILQWTIIMRETIMYMAAIYIIAAMLSCAVRSGRQLNIASIF